MTDEEKEQLAMADVQIFLELYGIKNEQGRELDFFDHPFLFDIFTDLSPHQAIRKAAQVGFSTTAIIKSLWLAKSRKMDLIYTLPTYGDVNDFVSSKVNRIIDQNPILKRWTADKDTIEQKRVGDSVIYYRGTWSDRAALMISSDLNVHDEVDRSNLAVVDQYYSRLQHSKYAWQWLFSNPSSPDIGVDKLWNRSDQKHWFVPCPKCKHQQYLTMLNIIERGKDDYYFGCVKCQTELNRRIGKWIKRWKDINDVSGYWISLLMCPWVTANRIKELERTKSAEYFDNFVLGIPHVGSGNSVTKDVIMRNLTDGINLQQGRIVIGVDPGIDIRYVVGNREGLFYYGQCKDYDELDNLMRRWDKAIMVMDQGGDIIGSRKLRDKYKNRVFLAAYRQDRKNDELFRWNDDEGTVQIDRNNTIQLLIDEFKDKRIPIYGTEAEWYDYWVHWSHIYRVVEEDSFGRPRYKWQRSDRDDWVHACFEGDTMITTEFGDIKIKDIKVGDFVLTRNGFEKVTFSGLIKQSEVLEIEIEDGRKITATPDHRFWTENEGFKELQHITKNDILVSIWNNNLTERLINYTKAKDILLEVEEKGCIERCGNFIMEIYRKTFTFIIKTIILLTMQLKIWKWLIRSNTYPATLYKKFLRTINVKYAELNINQKTREIINIAQSSAGLNSMQKGTIKWRGNVKSVKNDLPPISILGQSCVLKSVGVETLKSTTKKIPVYGITVKDSHEYFANGILVSNSVYWRTGLDRFMDAQGAIINIQESLGETGLTVDPTGRHFINQRQSY